MTIGDCYILRSDFHKIDIALIFIGETKEDYLFTPLNFPNNKFDNTPNAIFGGKLLAHNVAVGASLNKWQTGIFAINEDKIKPSFLTNYCKDNKPFITLNLDTDKIVLGQGGKDLNQIIIGGGTNLPEKKEYFDKFTIHSLTLNDYQRFSQFDLNIILKSN